MAKNKVAKANPVEEFFKSFDKTDEAIDFKFGHELFSEKLDVISTTSLLLDDALSSGGLPKGRLIQYYGPPACHAKDQGILMADGSVKKVQNIVQGDQVMGSDGSPRNVLETHSGFGKLYSVNPAQGNSHTISENHILTLARNNKFLSNHLTKKRNRFNKSGNKRNKKSNLVHLLDNDYDIIDMPLSEYMKLSSYKKSRAYKLQRYSVSFEKKQLDIPPYILGILLGDGSLQHGVGLTTIDDEILHEFTNYSNSIGLDVSCQKQENKTPFYKASGEKFKQNVFFNKIKNIKLNVGCGDKFIPHDYKTSSFEDRLELLAGILDTDGHRSDVNFDFISKSKQLAHDVAFVARSVGFCAKISETTKSAHKDHFGNYYRVYIGGKISSIPCRVKRKKIKTETSKDVLKTGFKISYIGDGNYYGFSVDGDNRYLLDDFTITHNSGKTFMAMLAIREAQRVDENAYQFFIDAEGTFDPAWASSLGVDISRVAIINGVTAAYGQKLFERLLGVPKADKKHKFVGKSKEGLLDKIADGSLNVNMMVLDSLGSLIPPGLDTAAVGQVTMGKMANFLTQTFAKLSVEVRKANVPFIVINHVRAGMDPYGPDHTFSGGNAYAHHLSANVYFKTVNAKDSQILNDNEEKIGGTIRAVVEKSKFGPHPRKCEFMVDYHLGVVNIHNEIAELACKYGIVDQTSSVMYEYGENKWRGKAKFAEGIQEDESLAKELMLKIDEARENERSKHLEVVKEEPSIEDDDSELDFVMASDMDSKEDSKEHKLAKKRLANGAAANGVVQDTRGK